MSAVHGKRVTNFGGFALFERKRNYISRNRGIRKFGMRFVAAVELTVYKRGRNGYLFVLPAAVLRAGSGVKRLIAACFAFNGRRIFKA